MQFAFSIHGAIAYPPGGTLGPRRTHDHELVWILAGRVAWEVDGVVHDLPSGALAISRPGSTETWRWDPRRPTRHAYVHFRVRDAAGLPPPARWPGPALPGPGDVLRPLAGQLLAILARRPPQWQELADSALAHLIRSWAAGATGAAPDSALPDPLSRAMQEVERRWAAGDWTPPALGELARAAGVGRVHLCRLFQRVCGRGPLAALRGLRLQRAAALLARGDAGVAEVAARCGFADAKLFSRRFSARFGCPPRTWRERARVGGALLAAEDPALAPLAARLGTGY